MQRVLVFLLVLGSMFVLPVSGDEWSAPEAYYSGATGSGAILKTQLAAAMSSGHIQRTYGDFRYSSAICDRDPAKSSNLILCYNLASVTAAWDGGNTWNREHVWPQSKQPGDASNSTKGNLGDPHSLRPCNPSINSSRSNAPFGGATLTGSYRYNGSFYFPGDGDKGNIARSLFYSATRYSGLTLVNGTPGTNQMGDLASLLRWHYMDVPDEFERMRNHKIYSRAYNPSYYTNNRNAFVDHPEFVWSVFGGNNNDTLIYVGDQYHADGSSAVHIDLGRFVTGDAALPAPVTVVMHKAGEHGTYYAVEPSVNVACLVSGNGRAFDYGTRAVTLTLQLKALPDKAGIYTETVTVDNLDVCGNSPAGRGSRDGNDIITVSYALAAHRADINADGRVDIGDLSLIASSWLTVAPEANIADQEGEPAGLVNIVDLAEMALAWLIGQ
ncbi:MAG: endonuclease [Sedimentisphaerales bacterium]|nr:endonuclease [Sedimentisphaerales bacterium]